MNIRWADVSEQDWFFYEVLEATNYEMEDGSPFVVGMPYCLFEGGASFLYLEQPGGGDKKVFTFESEYKAGPDSPPLYVFIDGVRTLTKSVKTDSLGTTTVELYHGTSSGSIVAFYSPGKPLVDAQGKPMWPGKTTLAEISYPFHPLDNGKTYHYNPLGQQFPEVLRAFGRSLRRLHVPDQEWKSTDPQDIAKKYIGYKQDVYLVSPKGLVTSDSPEGKATLYVPYNFNKVTMNFRYNSWETDGLKQRGGDFYAEAARVWRNDRFFPHALITRGEALTFLNRLRRSFYHRFTDLEPPGASQTAQVVTYDGQRVIPLPFDYETWYGPLTVKLDGVEKQPGVHYDVFDNERYSLVWKTALPKGRKLEISYAKTVGNRLADIGQDRFLYLKPHDMFTRSGGHNPETYWYEAAMVFEDLKLKDGSNLIEGIEVDEFRDGTWTDSETGETVEVRKAPVVNARYELNYGPANGEEETWFLPQAPLTRAQAVALLNRFRKWCVERFKDADPDMGLGPNVPLDMSGKQS